MEEAVTDVAVLHVGCALEKALKRLVLEVQCASDTVASAGDCTCHKFEQLETLLHTRARTILLSAFLL